MISSCDKAKQSSRRMEGVWEIRTYKLTFQDGISEYAECSGTLEVTSTDQDGWQNKMLRKIDYSFPSSTGSEDKVGLIKFRGKGDYMDVGVLDGSGNVVFLEDHRIMVLTRTDLQLIFADQYSRFHTMTFRKKK